MPELKPALAGHFLRAWVDNRDSKKAIEFEAPAHLRSDASVFEVQAYHREVFLTNKKARTASGERWAGVVPRVQGLGYPKWDLKSRLQLEYTSLSDIAPNIWAIGRVQQFGTNAERDIFGSLRGFQLKSQVSLSSVQPSPAKQTKIFFMDWVCSGTDRYDWNYSEHLTVVNPDYGSTDKGAIRPEDRTLDVYHSNAKRLEEAGEAAPYDVVLRPWKVTDARLLGLAVIDVSRRL